MGASTATSHLPRIDDCWNRIGVAGDQSCGKLQQHIHCRNCAVYADAAQRNLQRPVDAGYQQEWAAHFRRSEAAATELDASGLVFRIGCEWLALPTASFVAVAPQATPHRLPHRSAPGLQGIVNVGGTLYPCISLAALLDIDEQGGAAASGRHTFARLLLLQWEERAYALPVADLHGIVRYASAALTAPAATMNRGAARGTAQGTAHYLSGVLAQADMQIGVLDVALIGAQLARTLR